MATWTTLTDASFDPGEPATQAQGLALRDNPQAIAERATNAPIVQVPVKEYKTTGTGATWNIPSGVTAFEVHVTGGGGAADSGGNGTDSTFTYDGTTVTGGLGYGGNAGGGLGTTGGTATNGDLNINGGDGGATSLANAFAPGGASVYGGGTTTANGPYGCGEGVTNGNGGGAGATAIKRFTVNPSVTSATYTVGTGGGSNAGDGLIVIIY